MEKYCLWWTDGKHSQSFLSQLCLLNCTHWVLTTILKLICRYLLDRKRHVVLNVSEPSAVLSGVPHAVVSAGFLLFLIYFDAITQNLILLSLGSFMDIMLIISFCIAIKEHIQLHIDKMSDWVDRNHLRHSMLLRVKWWSSHAGECALPLKYGSGEL